MPAPQLLFDERGELVSFATLAILQFGTTRYMMHRYMDGEAAAVELLLHALPSIAHENKCDIIGGYVPSLPWLIDIFERSSVYARATATEQVASGFRTDGRARAQLAALRVPMFGCPASASRSTSSTGTMPSTQWR